MSTQRYAVQMRRFGECNFAGGMAAINQPGEYIDAQILDGVCVVTVDCWSWMHDQGLISGEFDADAWDELKLVLEQADGVTAKHFWHDAFRVARGLIAGMSVQLGNVPEFTIESYVAAIRSRPVVKIGQPDGLVGEAEIAAALGCSVDEVHARAKREGWPYWQCQGEDQPMVCIEPKKHH